MVDRSRVRNDLADVESNHREQGLYLAGVVTGFLLRNVGFSGNIEG